MKGLLMGSWLLALVLAVASPQPANGPRFAACMPAEVRLDELVSARSTGTGAPLTVGDQLSRLGARCRGRTLVTRTGRQIRLYRLLGCWGNPPADYQQQLARQRRELLRLRRAFTVVEIPCGLDPRRG
jgi:hypothetical protein